MGAVLPPPITSILPLKLSARVSPVGSRYGGNRADRIRHRIINKGVGRIGKSASRDIAAPTRIDEAADGRGGYVAERNMAGQRSSAPRPAGTGSKLPDLVYPLPSARDGVESAQNVQLVVKHGEAAGKTVVPAAGHGAATGLIVSVTGS